MNEYRHFTSQCSPRSFEPQLDEWRSHQVDVTAASPEFPFRPTSESPTILSAWNAPTAPSFHGHLIRDVAKRDNFYLFADRTALRRLRGKCLQLLGLRAMWVERSRATFWPLASPSE